MRERREGERKGRGGRGKKERKKEEDWMGEREREVTEKREG